MLVHMCIVSSWNENATLYCAPSFSETVPHFIAQASLELEVILLPFPLKDLDCRCEPRSPAQTVYFLKGKIFIEEGNELIIILWLIMN